MKHCGACGKKFETAKELAEHLKECPFALVGTKMMKKWSAKSNQKEKE